MNKIDLSEYFTIEQVATELGISVATIWRWVKAGKLTPATYVFGRVLFKRADVIAYGKISQKTRERWKKL